MCAYYYCQSWYGIEVRNLVAKRSTQSLKRTRWLFRRLNPHLLTVRAFTVPRGSDHNIEQTAALDQNLNF